MLLGQDLRRHHQRDLTSGGHDLERRREGDRGLSRSDIALQQSVHRHIGSQIGADNVPGCVWWLLSPRWVSPHALGLYLRTQSRQATIRTR